MRLDKFLKVSRLIKRRTVANEACSAGRVLVNGKAAKAGTNVKPGDRIDIQFGNRETAVEVVSIAETVKKDNTITAILRGQRDSIYESFGDSTFCFIKQNLNPLGGYLFMTLEHMFNEQQANDLKRLGIEKWKPEP